MVGRERGAGTTTVCSSDAVNWADRKTTILREPAQSNLGRLPARREPPAMGARARAKHRAPTRPDFERAPSPNVHRSRPSFAMAMAMITCQVCFERRKEPGTFHIRQASPAGRET